MAGQQLTAFEHILLGLILQAPSSGYDLKRIFAATPLPPDKAVSLDQPLPPLGQHLLGVAIALDTHQTGHVPDIDPRTATGRQADDYMNDRTARIYPGLVPRPF